MLPYCTQSHRGQLPVSGHVCACSVSHVTCYYLDFSDVYTVTRVVCTRYIIMFDHYSIVTVLINEQYDQFSERSRLVTSRGCSIHFRSLPHIVFESACLKGYLVCFLEWLDTSRPGQKPLVVWYIFQRLLRLFIVLISLQRLMREPLR